MTTLSRAMVRRPALLLPPPPPPHALRNAQDRVQRRRAKVSERCSSRWLLFDFLVFSLWIVSSLILRGFIQTYLHLTLSPSHSTAMNADARRTTQSAFCRASPSAPQVRVQHARNARRCAGAPAWCASGFFCARGRAIRKQALCSAARNLGGATQRSDHFARCFSSMFTHPVSLRFPRLPGVPCREEEGRGVQRDDRIAEEEDVCGF